MIRYLIIHMSMYTLACSCLRRLLNHLIGTPGTIRISSYRSFRLDRRCSMRSVDSRSQLQRGGERVLVSSAAILAETTRRVISLSSHVVRHWESYWDVRQEKKHPDLSILHVKKSRKVDTRHIGAELKNRELILCSFDGICSWQSRNYFRLFALRRSYHRQQ